MKDTLYVLACLAVIFALLGFTSWKLDQHFLPDVERIELELHDMKLELRALRTHLDASRVEAPLTPGPQGPLSPGIVR